LIPIVDGDAEDGSAALPPRVVALSVPHDIEEDVTYRYVQSFAAGNCSIRKSNSNTANETGSEQWDESIPVVAYAWPGGLVSLYSCKLLASPARSLSPTLNNNDDDLLLKELVERGCAELLRTLLLSSPDNVDDDEPIGVGANGLLHSPLWKDARDEIRSYEGPVPMNDVAKVCFAGDLAAFRSLLMEVSSDAKEA